MIMITLTTDAAISCHHGYMWHCAFKVHCPKYLKHTGRCFKCDLIPIYRNGKLSYFRAVKGTIKEKRVVTQLIWETVG